MKFVLVHIAIISLTVTTATKWVGRSRDDVYERQQPLVSAADLPVAEAVPVATAVSIESDAVQLACGGPTRSQLLRETFRDPRCQTVRGRQEMVAEEQLAEQLEQSTEEVSATDVFVVDEDITKLFGLSMALSLEQQSQLFDRIAECHKLTAGTLMRTPRGFRRIFIALFRKLKPLNKFVHQPIDQDALNQAANRFSKKLFDEFVYPVRSYASQADTMIRVQMVARHLISDNESKLFGLQVLKLLAEEFRVAATHDLTHLPKLIMPKLKLGSTTGSREDKQRRLVEAWIDYAWQYVANNLRQVVRRGLAQMFADHSTFTVRNEQTLISIADVFDEELARVRTLPYPNTPSLDEIYNRALGRQAEQVMRELEALLMEDEQV